MSCLSFVNIRTIAETWLHIDGKPEANISALEPTLWSDGDKNIYDVITFLSDIGYNVNMTTNGSNLFLFNKSLKSCGLKKLRISWHTMDANTYKSITTHGNYNNFMKGIHIAIKNGENIAFNRILINDYLSDLEEQIFFVDKYGLRIKLYELLWTKNISPYYGKFYVSPDIIISRINKLNNFKDEPETEKPENRRARKRYRGLNGGIIEIKYSQSSNKNTVFCKNCMQNEHCIEGFGDYFRISPRGMGGFCYMRPDLDRPIIENGNADFDLVVKLYEESGKPFDDFKKNNGLCFVLTSRCNYHCSLPGVNASFCLMAMRAAFK